MGKNEGKKKDMAHKNSALRPSTLKVKEKGTKGPHDADALLKMRHLEKLATWAGGEGGIPQLGAFFGCQLAASCATHNVPLSDPSSVPCRRCETILQPGLNCTVRVEKQTCKRRKRKTHDASFQNIVVYTCNFCSFRNIKRGTTRSHLKTLEKKMQLESRIQGSNIGTKDCSDSTQAKSRTPSKKSLSFVHKKESSSTKADSRPRLLEARPSDTGNNSISFAVALSENKQYSETTSIDTSSIANSTNEVKTSLEIIGLNQNTETPMTCDGVSASTPLRRRILSSSEKKRKRRKERSVGQSSNSEIVLASSGEVNSVSKSSK